MVVDRIHITGKVMVVEIVVVDVQAEILMVVRRRATAGCTTGIWPAGEAEVVFCFGGVDAQHRARRAMGRHRACSGHHSCHC